MSNITTTEADNLLAASFGTGDYTAPTAPLKLALMTVTGDRSSAGTEVSGGSYVQQSLAMDTPSGESTSSTAEIDFTGMPEVSGGSTVTGITIYDSSTTPVRKWFGDLQSPKTTNSGDTLSFSVGAISATLQ
jgi:hypothetical protein